MNTLRQCVLVAAISFLVLAPLATGLAAHPTASSFVTIDRPAPTRLRVVVTTDAESLLLKLEALSGTAPLRRPSVAEIDRRIQDLGATLTRHVELTGDDRPIALTITDVARIVDSPGRVAVTLTGDASDATRKLRWRTSLFYGAYPLAIRSDPAATPLPDEDYEWLNGAQLSQPHDVADPVVENGWSRLVRLIPIGFTHIVPGGLDHVLFVLGLFLLARDGRALLLQISAFTVAHSLTLGLAMAGWVSVPGQIVEPLIAASIAYIAVENLVKSSLSRWRLAVVFLFGLLHGLGFASALGDLGLSSAHYVATLAGFNIGVELGQLAVVVVAAMVVRALPVSPETYRRLLVRPASAAIAAMGIFWAVQRVLF